jgi:hydroxyacylglutathione hydrolase
MFFHQFRLQDMGCATYLIGSETSRKAAIVDPTSRLEDYLRVAEEHHLQITYIFETHLHADHVSGNRQVAALTGAEIYLHKSAHAAYPHHPLEGGEVFDLGADVRLSIIYTPGHTWEMINLLVEDPTSAGILIPGEKRVKIG